MDGYPQQDTIFGFDYVISLASSMGWSANEIPKCFTVTRTIRKDVDILRIICLLYFDIFIQNFSMYHKCWNTFASHCVWQKEDDTE